MRRQKEGWWEEATIRTKLRDIEKYNRPKEKGRVVTEVGREPGGLSV